MKIGKNPDLNFILLQSMSFYKKKIPYKMINEHNKIQK